MYSGYYTKDFYTAPPAPGYYPEPLPMPLPMYGGGYDGGPAPGCYGGVGVYSYRRRRHRHHHHHHHHRSFSSELEEEEKPETDSEEEPELLELLDDFDKTREKVALNFTNNWFHTDRKLERIRYVYEINLDQSSTDGFEAYRTQLDDDSVRMLWHGTPRNCSLGNDPTDLDPCKDSRCSLCQILRGGFKLSKARASGMFGRGIYSTPVSSKAALYSTNDGQRTQYHAVLWNEVALGKSYHATPPWPDTYPPPGYDSVHGKTGDASPLKFQEYCVYDNNAIQPKYLVLYKEVAN